ncbi:alpha/beta hydrolase family protein [Corynebacterium sp.]|uniref:alpha/beta hydrolase n=1 Tax=Corynebacterium sp. TaxID=1720 RepID=UPI0026DBE1BB|nr:alpha/beta hydrolase family protein [Corynebacterium sp.]MDO5031899.1 alpha/beta hydrolase family protein [Corynebacterium sp.]
MKTARSLATLAAATAIALGSVVAPAASASPVTPDQIAGDATPSQITEMDIYDVLEQYLVADKNGVQPPSKAEYEDSIGKNVTYDGKDGRYLLTVKGLPEKYKWLFFVFKYPDYRQNIKGLWASSPAMEGRKIPLAYVPAKEPNSPTYYLLNGAGGADQGMDWIVSTSGKDVDPSTEGIQELDEFYRDRNVNLIIPQEGAFTYYTDWVESPDSGYLKGPQKWETFLTKELPGPLEEHIGANGKRAIGGMSMAATSALVLAQHNPNFYDAIASYAGCAATSYPFPNFFAEQTVSRGGGTTEQMWGPKGGEYNRYNDGLINATKNNMGNSEVYVSAGSGLAGMTDTFSYRLRQGVSPQAAFQGSSTTVVEGGVIEAAVSSCTHDLKAKMDHEGVKADWNFRATGTHSWPGWIEDISKSWPTLERAFAKAEAAPEEAAEFEAGTPGSEVIEPEAPESENTDKTADADLITADKATPEGLHPADSVDPSTVNPPAEPIKPATPDQPEGNVTRDEDTAAAAQ